MAQYPLHNVNKISNLKQMLSQSVETFGPKPAFYVKHKGSDSYSPITYSQFGKDVDSLGTALIDMGLKGKRIAIMGENRYEWAVSYLAAINGTGIVVPLDKELPNHEVENLMMVSQASAIIFSGKYKSVMQDICSRLESVEYLIDMDSDSSNEEVLSYTQLIEKGRKLMADGDSRFLDATIDEEAMNILLFTSGTTSEAKAVMLSHKNICTNLMDMSTMVYFDEKDTFLSVLPIHHTYECTCGFLCPIYKGASVAYCEGLKHIVKNLKEANATIMLGVPLIFETIYKKLWEQASKKKGMRTKLKVAISVSNMLRKTLNIDITRKIFAPIYNTLGSNVRLFISGAAAINPKVLAGFRSLGIDALQGYGLTECSPILTVNRDHYFDDASAGIPLPSVKVRIDNPNDEGIGEIVAKGDNVMLGYYNNEEATTQSIKDGWFHTGDLGYMNKENFLFITGRKKSVIVTKNGKNIFPEEIEMLLNTIPYVKESMVWGKSGESSADVEVQAIIVPDFEKIEEDFKENPLSEDGIYELIKKEIKTVNKQLPLYKYVRDFTIKNEEFAKTTTKKIKRYLENTPKQD